MMEHLRISERKKRVGTVAVVAAVIAAIMITGAIITITRNQTIMRFFRREVVISVAGDILLDRGVADAIEKRGMAYPYEAVAPVFNQDDLTVANLECPLTVAGGGAMKARRFVFKAAPENAALLKSAGFEVMALANNHTMDYVSEGLADTMTALDKTGIFHAGAGLGEVEIRPCFIRKNGLCVGLLSYSSLPPEGFMHDGDEATIAYARAGFLAEMQMEIAAAAEQCDFLMVYFHWGTEYRHDVSGAQVEIAHAAVDSGADAVVGAHPHVLQGREWYQEVPIYYSIGNFVFDKQIPEGTDEGLIVQFTVGEKGISSINELPVVIEDCQPRLAEGERAAEIEADMIRYSRRFT